MRKKGERTIQAIDTTTRSALDNFGLITLRAYLGGSETALDAEVVSAAYTASVGGGDGFSIGNACSAELVIVLAGVGATAGNQSLRVTWDAAGTEYPLFTGTASKATTSGSQTTITAYDALDSVSSTPYEPTLTGSCTAAEALADIAAQMGVALDADTKTLAAGTALTEGMAALEGLSLSSAAANIALLLGGNAVITRAGSLAVRRFTDCGWETESYAGGATPEDTAYSVDGLTFQRTDTTTATDEDGITTESSTSTDYTASASSGAGLSYSTNLATQALVDGAYEALAGLSFRAGSFSVQGGLFVEPGDLIAVDGLTVAVSGISLSLDGGCKTTITSLGQSDTSSAGGSITQAISAIQQDYAEFKTMVADNISATNANFTNVLAGYIKTDELEATVATFGYLTADSATITDLTAEVANINSVLAGNVGAGTIQTVHLTSDNVVIDDAVITDAMIVDLTASKITAGTIYTSLVRIANDTGENLLIDGATLQIKDSNGTYRIQMGEDGDGNYSYYLWDAEGNLIFDALGAYALHDNIIKDINVAEDAAISGTKLDISSVAECLNGDGSITVDYSKVTIDNSTLSAWYTTVNTKTDELEDATSTLQTGLEVVQGQITAKVWQSDIATAISGISVGSRNYLRNTRTFSGWTKSSYVSLAEDDEGYTVATWSGMTAAGWNQLRSAPIQFSAVRGAAVTLSLDVRSSEYESINASDTSGLILALSLCAGDSTSRIRYRTENLRTTALTEAWQRITLTVTLTDDYFTSGSGTIDDATRFFVQIYDYSAYTLEVRRPKLELGSVATDWTPAPEDAESEITTLSDQYSALNLTVDGITAEVADLTTTVSDNYTTLSSKVTTLETTATSIIATVRESTAIQSENIIADGTFEGYTTFGTSYSWYRPSSTYITVGTYDDVSCICFTRGGSGYYIRQTVSLPAGTYIVKVKLACGSDYAPVCRIRLYSSSGNVYAYLCGDGELTNEWVTYSTTITTEYTSTYFYLYCYSATGTTTATATEMYATDIVLYSSTELDAAMAQIQVLSDSIALCVTTDSDTGYLRLGNGEDDTVKFTVDTTNFTVDENGNLTIAGTINCGDGVIGGWNIASTKIYGTAADGTTTAVMQISGLTEDTAYVFACGGTSHSSYADCPFRVNKLGGMWVKEVVVADNLAVGGNVSAAALVGGNDNGLYCRNASDTAIRMAYLSVNDNVVLGHSDYATYINGSAVTISANLTASGTVFVPNSGIALANGYGVHHYTSGGSYAKFEYVNASDQLIFGNSSYATYLYGSSITSSKSITTSSDRRLKEDIQPLDELGLVDALAPVSYRLRDDPALVHYGFVAQDVEAALDALGIHDSALVQTNAATGMKSIAYVEIIPLLLTEIQKLKQTVGNLQKEVCK